MGDKNNSDWGKIIIDCNHADSKGVKFYEY